MTTRILTAEDHDALVQLLADQRSYFGIDIDKFPGDLTSKRAQAIYLDQYLQPTCSYFKCFGTFKEGRLVGTITSDFMQEQPTWILRRIIVREELKGRFESYDVIQSLMTAALKAAEDAGYYQHIYLIPAKYKRAHAKIWGENDVRKGRYQAYELESVPANQASKFRMHWEALYGRIMFPIDTVVRMSVLNDELRRAP